MAFLQVHRLTYRYPDGTPALDGVSFGIDAGQSVGLVGPNGAGKSTLLLHLNGLLPGGRDPHGHSHGLLSGEARQEEPKSLVPPVEVDGLPAVRENLAKIRQLVGLLFQDPDDQLFCPTVREDVAFGPLQQGLSRDEVRARIADALALVGLSGYDDRVPHHLSFGERKRVCLAGVLACRPRLLVLDEPTANLDPRSRRQFMSIVQSLEGPKLIASHDLEMILELCPRVIVLDGGKVVADGATREVLANEPLMLTHGLEVPLSLKIAMG